MDAYINKPDFFVTEQTNGAMENVSRFHFEENKLEEDKQQVLAAKADRKNFEVLYTKYYERIFRFVHQRLDSKEAAFDITHQVFLKAMVSLDKYEVRNVPFSAWLYRIALNELTHLFRKNSKERALNVSIDDIAGVAAELETDDKEEKLNLIAQVISTLPEEEVQLIEMRFFEKKSFKEIGEIISITENNTKVRTYRLLDKIKKIVLNK